MSLPHLQDNPEMVLHPVEANNRANGLLSAQQMMLEKLTLAPNLIFCGLSALNNKEPEFFFFFFSNFNFGLTKILK